MTKRWLLPMMLVFAAGSLQAQGRGNGGGHGPKHYAVSNDRAVSVTREVLVKQGYEVIRIERSGPDEVVWYRRGNMGRGRGKGPPVRMVIHREADHVVFVDTPSDVLVNIDVRLRLP
jgi:hypothetical protein